MPPVLVAAIPAVAAFAAANPVTWAVASVALTAAIGAGATWLGNKIAGSQNPAQAQNMAKTPGGVQGSLLFGANQPRMVPIGRVGTYGHMFYAQTTGNDGKTLHIAQRLGDCVCDSLNAVWVNGKRRTITSVTPTNNADLKYTVDGVSEITLYFYRGTYSQSASTILTGGADPSSRWTTDYKMRGVCYVVATIELNRNKFQSIPQLFYDLNGARLYDWRKDTTNGGSGSHRWNNRSTWEFTSNPVVADYNYRRGFWIAADTSAESGWYFALGMTLPQTDLSMTHYTAAANSCDEMITRPSDTDNVRYAVSAILRSDLEHRQNLETLQQGFSGYVVERAGIYSPLAGVAQASVYTITDADLFPSEPVHFQAFAPRDQLANKILGEYSEPDEMFKATAFQPFAPATYLTQDNGHRLETPVDLSMFISKEMAERVANIRLNEVRMQATATITLPLKYLKGEAGDWITWASDDLNIGTRTWIIASRELIRGKMLRLNLRETSSAVFDHGALPRVKYTGPSGRNNPTKANNISVTSLAGGQITTGSGRQRATIDIAYTPITDSRVRAVAFRYRLDGTTKVNRARDDEPEAGSFSIVQDLLPGETYNVAWRLITEDRRDTPWSAYSNVTTLSRSDLLGADLANDSVEDNKLKRDARKIHVRKLTWTINAAGTEVSWTQFHVTWLEDNGTPNTFTVAAGLQAYGGTTRYLCWNRSSATSMTVETDPEDVRTNRSICLAVYDGGFDLSPNWGKWKNRPADMEADSVENAAVATDAITNPKILNTTILKGKVANQTLSATQIEVDGVTVFGKANNTPSATNQNVDSENTANERTMINQNITPTEDGKVFLMAIIKTDEGVYSGPQDAPLNGRYTARWYVDGTLEQTKNGGLPVQTDHDVNRGAGPVVQEIDFYYRTAPAVIVSMLQYTASSSTAKQFSLRLTKRAAADLQIQVDSVDLFYLHGKR